MWRGMLSSAKQRAKAKGLTFSLTLQDIHAMWREQDGRCYWFGVQLDQNVPSRDPFLPSLDRRDNHRGYTRDNVVLACWAANMAKQNTSIERWGELLADMRPRVTESARFDYSQSPEEQ